MGEKFKHRDVIVVKKNQLDAQLILSTFRQILQVSGVFGPPSGGTTICIQQLVLINLFR
jgi:hypothetical protein